MNRRDLLRRLALVPAIPIAAAQEYSKRVNGMAPLTIKDVKVITTSGGRNYRWVFLKVITSEPGLYGIGSANNQFSDHGSVGALEDHLKPWLIGKDPDRIEDLWQSGADAHLLAQWAREQQRSRGDGYGAVGHQGQARRHAGLSLLGGKAHDAVAVYDHQGGRD